MKNFLGGSVFVPPKHTSFFFFLFFLFSSSHQRLLEPHQVIKGAGIQLKGPRKLLCGVPLVLFGVLPRLQPRRRCLWATFRLCRPTPRGRSAGGMRVQGRRPPDCAAIRQSVHNDLFAEGLVFTLQAKLPVAGVKRDESDGSRDEGDEDCGGQDGTEDPGLKDADGRGATVGGGITMVGPRSR